MPPARCQGMVLAPPWSPAAAAAAALVLRMGIRSGPYMAGNFPFILALSGPGDRGMEAAQPFSCPGGVPQLTPMPFDTGNFGVLALLLPLAAVVWQA
jgi:hypothetical protein